MRFWCTVPLLLLHPMLPTASATPAQTALTLALSQATIDCVKDMSGQLTRGHFQDVIRITKPSDSKYATVVIRGDVPEITAHGVPIIEGEEQCRERGRMPTICVFDGIIGFRSESLVIESGVLEFNAPKECTLFSATNTHTDKVNVMTTTDTVLTLTDTEVAPKKKEVPKTVPIKIPAKACASLVGERECIERYSDGDCALEQMYLPMTRNTALKCKDKTAANSACVNMRQSGACQEPCTEIQNLVTSALLCIHKRDVVVTPEDKAKQAVKVAEEEEAARKKIVEAAKQEANAAANLAKVAKEEAAAKVVKELALKAANEAAKREQMTREKANEAANTERLAQEAVNKAEQLAQQKADDAAKRKRLAQEAAEFQARMANYEQARLNKEASKNAEQQRIAEAAAAHNRVFLVSEFDRNAAEKKSPFPACFERGRLESAIERRYPLKACESSKTCCDGICRTATCFTKECKWTDPKPPPGRGGSLEWATLVYEKEGSGPCP